MTAINPARLKIQCASLVEKYSNPGGFVSGLHDLLGFYASRIRQTSLARTNLTMQAYQVPAPVLRALENELDEMLTNDPLQGLLLVDALWQEEWVEFRQLAIILLGNLPSDLAENIFDHIRTWLGSCTAEDVRRSILTRGLERLGREKPALVLNFFEELIAGGGKGEYQSVLFGLLPFVDNPAFDNLPVVYDLVSNILMSEENKLIKEITTLLRALLKRSEQETTYFLVRQLATAAKPRIFRVIRQLVPEFSDENKALLKKTLQNYV